MQTINSILNNSASINYLSSKTMVNTLLNRFIGKLKKDSDSSGSSNDSSAQNVATSNQIDSGESTDSIDLVGFVELVVRSLVEQPDEVSVISETDERGVIIKVSCNKDEIRKIIGRRGKTINAIRILVKGAAKRLDKNVSVKVLD